MVIPWNALLGGMLLGISASLLLLFKGKIAGISGILSGSMVNQDQNRGWRIQFLLGLVVGGFLTNGLLDPAFTAIPTNYSTSTLGMLCAGLLVGIGTKLGNGCTSGHGICGMGRFSVRSTAATITFMLVAALVVFVRLHLV